MKVAHTYHREEVFEQIRSGKKGRDGVIGRLYHDQSIRNAILSIIKKGGGQDQDFDLVFNTTLMQFVKSVIKNRELKITTSVQGYLYGIAKYVWLNEFRKGLKSKTEELEGKYDLAETGWTPESLLINQSKMAELKNVLLLLGRNCKEVLMHWANGYNMTEIAKMMDYKSEMMARKKKYKCFKELLDYLERHPEVKQVLR